MSRLIDADALIKSLSVDPIECPGCPEPEFLDELIEILENAPIVEERKTGHWIRVSADKYTEHAQHFYKCDQCGDSIIGTHNFCPSCGSFNGEKHE